MKRRNGHVALGCLDAKSACPQIVATSQEFWAPKNVAFWKGNGAPKISGTSRLVKYIFGQNHISVRCRLAKLRGKVEVLVHHLMNR